MKRRILGTIIVFAAFAAVVAIAFAPALAAQELKPGPTYQGMCDASAAVAIDADRFLVANDEDNILRLYHRQRPAQPLGQFNLEAHLGVEPDEPESDMEGACMLGGRIFWITSHGRNKKDKVRESRWRLFATQVVGVGDNATIGGVGKVYSRLLADLIRDPRLAKFNLAEASEKAPKKKGALNIEGLAATPDGHLLVAFRNPITGGKALVVPIENPNEIIDEGAPAKLGAPIELALSVGGDGLGVRSIEYDATAKAYWVIAGSYEGGGRFGLFRWTGGTNAPAPVKRIDFGELNPEAIFVYPGETRRVQVLSDDGTKEIGGKECKKVGDPSQRSFRSAFFEPSAE